MPFFLLFRILLSVSSSALYELKYYLPLCWWGCAESTGCCWVCLSGKNQVWWRSVCSEQNDHVSVLVAPGSLPISDASGRCLLLMITAADSQIKYCLEFLFSGRCRPQLILLHSCSKAASDMSAGNLDHHLVLEWIISTDKCFFHPEQSVCCNIKKDRHVYLSIYNN